MDTQDTDKLPDIRQALVSPIQPYQAGDDEPLKETVLAYLDAISKDLLTYHYDCAASMHHDRVFD